MNKPLITLTTESADEIVKKITQAQTITLLLADATEEMNEMIENSMVNNIMWLISDLLADISAEMNNPESVIQNQ